MLQAMSVSALRWPSRGSAAIIALAISVAFPTLSVTAAQPSAGTISGVVNVDGKPIRGASVLIEVLPSMDDAANAAAGTPVDYRVVASGQTDTRGRFAVVPSGIPSDRIDVFGVANFQATVSNGLKRVHWHFPMKVGNGDKGPSSVVASSDMVFDLGANAGVADTANPPAAWIGISSGQMTSAGLVPVEAEQIGSSDGSVQAAAPICQGVWTNNWQYGVNEAFANAWAWSGGKATFHESQTTSHTLGIAFHASSGSWSVDGSTSLSETGSNFGDTSGLVDRQVNNRVNYREISYGMCGSRWLPVSTYALQTPILYYSSSSHPYWPGCASYVNGQVIGKTTGTNSTFSGGVAFNPIHLSAQSGWSTSVSIKWTFTANSWLCGSTSQGVGPSPNAESHQR